MRKAPRVYVVFYGGTLSSVWDTPEAAIAETERISKQRYAKNMTVSWREYRVKSKRTEQPNGEELASTAVQQS